MKRKIISGKKGFFFTVIAVYLVAALMLSTFFYDKYEMREEASVESARILAMNDFIKDVDADLERGLYISGFRTILGIEEYIATNGKLLNEINYTTESAFREVFFNKSINGYAISVMNDSSFSDWEGRINEHADDLSIYVIFTVDRLEITQENPWNVEVYMNTTMIVYDMLGMASWDRHKTIHAQIPVTGFEDPLYTKNSYGRLAHTIEPAQNTNFVTGNDTSVLLAFLNSSLYTESTTAPSFLMRLEENLSNSSCCGIESLVEVNKMTAQGIPAKDRSIVDYIYFGTRATADQCIDNAIAQPDMPVWFRLDIEDSHISKYQIAALAKNC